MSLDVQVTSHICLVISLYSPYQAGILAPDIAQFPQKNQIISKKKFFKIILSYLTLKFQKYSVSIVFLALVFLSVNILIDTLLMQFLYIQNRKMCLSKKIYTKTLLLFCPAWDSFLENILYIITQH